MDFRSEMRREEFERLAQPIFTRCAAPLVALLEQTGVDLADVEAVEMLGGGTRIPGVVAALTVALGGRAPDRCVTLALALLPRGCGMPLRIQNSAGVS